MIQWLARSLAGLGFAMGVALYGFDLANGHAIAPSTVGTLVLLAFLLVGVLVAARRPRNPLGWLYLVAAILITFSGNRNLAAQYAYYALATRPGSLPAAEWVLWSAQFVVILAFGGFITFGLLLFPDGRLPSPRWRPVAVATALALVAVTVARALTPGLIHVSPQSSLAVINPVGVAGLWDNPALVGLAFTVVPLGACGVASVFVRFRRANGLERQQLKWFAYGAAWIPAVGLLGVLLDRVAHEVFGSVVAELWPLSVAGIPIATGIAILRHRLYDIDVLINRTIVYGALSAALGATYFLAVLALETMLRPLTAGSEVAVALSTLVVVALFQPLRRRIQNAVDQRFYRSRYDAARTLDLFGERLRDEVDLEAVRASLLGAVERTVHPAQASVWLRERSS